MAQEIANPAYTEEQLAKARESVKQTIKMVGISVVVTAVMLTGLMLLTSNAQNADDSSDEEE